MRLPRNAQIWAPSLARSYLSRLWNRQSRPSRQHVWVTVADHFEPYWRGAEDAVAARRVARWVEAWPRIASRHRDELGRPPRYVFFYPEEEYRPVLLASLAELCRQGIADVEVHIHHDGEGEADFSRRMRGFIRTLADGHGLLRTHQGQTVFGFIHGNWALDNSSPDGRWCGLDNEISLLQQLGCYADFTMPAAPDPAQSRMVNVIYWAEEEEPPRPRSHDHGRRVELGGPDGPGLLMVPGPLAIGRHGRRLLAPSLEVGELAAHSPPSRHRVRLWLANAPRLGAHRFIKLHSHGAQEANADCLLDGGLDELFRLFREETESRGWRLHFASAWEMVRAIHAVRIGQDPTSPVG